MELENFPEDSMIGRHIGVHKLVREIGRGGMGAVYLAERIDGEFDQTVAIKLIKRGMDTDLILKRFRRERQILAALNHINIAYFLGGGSTDDGLPYYVMEYIEGEPLYRFCDEHHLTIADRLAIFRQICWAVDAAHRIKVIHRDLKPSNILVKADGKPKLLDFGIAKALDPELMATDIDPTATQMRLMTPEYAAPEQISGDSITPATDIYSLGVVLYELMTGHRPYRLKRHIPHEVARVICEEEPALPSGSLVNEERMLPTSDGGKASLKTVIDARNSSFELLRRELSGDLDKIILKALRKNPSERYGSAAELADDITNYLEQRPVNAEVFPTTRPPTGRSAKVSVAVLPLKMLNRFSQGDTGDEFLGVGLADALISRLSGVQRLIVRPTSSILPFSEEEPFIAGQRLGVDYVLDGNIRRAGNRMRVSMQLLDVAENATKWAKAFDEELADVLDLEDSISGLVATALLPQLTGDERKRLEKRGTNMPEAYEAYLRGRYFWSRFTDENLSKAVEAFQEAIRLDPEYALPYVGIADFYNWAAIFGAIPSNEAFPLAQESARRALEIDDSIAEAYAVLAFSTLLYEWNWTGAEHLVKRALELNPNNSFAHECYSNFLLSQGRFDEGLAEIKRAEDLDPVAPKALLMTAWSLYQTRHFRESVAKARKAGDMQDNFPQGLLHLGNALTQVGRTDEAIIKLQESARLWDSGMPKFLLCFALAANGQKEEARDVLNDLLERAKTGYMKPYFIAMAYVSLGEYDAAFEWFEKSFEERNEWLIWLGTDPKLDPIRSDPRYFDLLKRTGNPIYGQQAQKTAESPQTGEREKSIAVLPFKIIGAYNTGDTGEEYLSIGLADALTMRLSNVRRFLVRPTSSVLPFAERVTDPFAAGRELGVEFIVDGNIRRIGDRIRVTTQLLEVGENSTRWSESFDENFTDVLELEDLISEKVAESLIPRLTGEERKKLSKRGTENPEAYEAYLRGRYFWNQFTPESFTKAISAFQRAVDLDPKYATAYVGIADFYSWACIYGMIPPAQSMQKVIEAANQALEIDNTLPEAYAAKGLYYSNSMEWERSEENHRHSIALNPNYPLSHEWLAAILVGTGRFEDGIEEIKIAERLDPLSLRAKVLTAWTIYQTRNYEAALAKANEIIDLNPDFMQGYLQLCNILLQIGQPEAALEAAIRGVELAGPTPLPIYQLCFAYAANGKKEEAHRALEDLIALNSNGGYVPPYFLAMSHVAVGEIDTAFEYFEKAVAELSPWTIWFGTEPKLDAIRQDSRYIKLLRATGNPIADKILSP